MMEREKLLRYLEKRYLSKKEMLTRIPLGVQPDALWQEILNNRRAKSEVLPLYGPKGTPYWYLTTEKMVMASEKIVETLYENDAEFDPYNGPSTVSTLEEVFYTSFVEGSQISMREALDFLSGERPPRDIEEQLIANNRAAGGFAAKYLASGIDAPFLCELTAILTDGMDNGGGDYRVSEEVDYIPTDGDNYTFPRAQLIPDRVNDLCTYLASPGVHPLIKSAVAQGYILALRPFPEGNDRLGRILSSMILHRCGYGFLNEVSASALIARKSYAYYEAIGNILREENGGDFTYFLEYYLELLSRGVDERTYRLRQREKQALQDESQLARSALAESIPQSGQDSDLQLPEPGPPISVQSNLSDDAESQESTYLVEIETEDKSLGMARVKDELYRCTKSSGFVIKACAELFLTYMKQGIETFITEDIARDCSLMMYQVDNLITQFRIRGLIEKTEDFINQHRVYRLSTKLPLLTPNDYTEDVISAVNKLLNSETSPKERRIGEMIRSCLPKGIISPDDYVSFGGKEDLTDDMLMLENMGLVERLSDEEYHICRKIRRRSKNLNFPHRSTLTQLYRCFGHNLFTRKMAIDVLGLHGSSTLSILHQFADRGILESFKSRLNMSSPYYYRLLVEPTKNPEMFLPGSSTYTVTEAPIKQKTAGDDSKASYTQEKKDGATENELTQEIANYGCSEAFLKEIRTLVTSPCSLRDRRLGRSLLKCLQKGTILREDYMAWGYTDHMWEKDILLAKQLGLISKQDDGVFRLNSNSAPIHPGLNSAQKRTVTAIYEAFGDGTFSQQMFMYTLKHSRGKTSTCLHKLTLLRILNQKTTPNGNQYRLLVNPEDNPECFVSVA